MTSQETWHLVRDNHSRIAELERQLAEANAATARAKAESEHHNQLATKYFGELQAALTALAEAVKGLKRWRFIVAEHDIEDVHPLTWVNAISETDDTLARIEALKVQPEVAK